MINQFLNMAKNKSLVLLGFDDDLISEKQKQSLDFKINKIGGKPVRIIY